MHAESLWPWYRKDLGDHGPPPLPSCSAIYKHGASKFSVCGFLSPQHHLGSCIPIQMYSSSYLFSTTTR